jgi:hypothetical protein
VILKKEKLEVPSLKHSTLFYNTLALFSRFLSPPPFLPKHSLFLNPSSLLAPGGETRDEGSNLARFGLQLTSNFSKFILYICAYKCSGLIGILVTQLMISQGIFYTGGALPPLVT